MFTGIVDEVGTLRQIEPTGLVIQAQRVLEGVEVKESIAVDGACLQYISNKTFCESNEADVGLSS